MAITIKDCHIENCGTGISTDGSVQIDISGTRIVGCQKAIEQRDPPGLINALGLPPNTPSNLLIDALQLLIETQHEGPERSVEKVSKSGLFQWLDGAANGTAILSNLVSLQQSGFVQAVINMIPK